MNKELIFAKIIKAILSGDRVDPSTLSFDKNTFDNIIQKIELCNAIVVPHKKRYAILSTQEERDAEIKRLEKDYCTVFNESGLSFVPVALIKSMFLFMMEDMVHETTFREICVNLVGNLGDCDSREIRYFIYLKLIQSIVHGSLYGAEPFDTILKDAIEFLDNAEVDSSALNRIMFLE